MDVQVQKVSGMVEVKRATGKQEEEGAVATETAEIVVGEPAPVSIYLPPQSVYIATTATPI